MPNSKKFLFWGLGLIVFSFVSIPGGFAIRDCLTGNFDGGFSFLLFLLLFASGYFYFIRGLSSWKTRLLAIVISLLVFLFLAFIVIFSLNTARTRTKAYAYEAYIKSSMSAMRATAELKIINDEKTSNYYYPADICNQDTGILSDLFRAIKSNGANNSTCLTSSDFKSWAVSSELPLPGSVRIPYFCKSPIFPSTQKGSGRFYCVDSSGFASESDGQITSPACR